MQKPHRIAPSLGLQDVHRRCHLTSLRYAEMHRLISEGNSMSTPLRGAPLWTRPQPPGWPGCEADLLQKVGFPSIERPEPLFEPLLNNRWLPYVTVTPSFRNASSVQGGLCRCLEDPRRFGHVETGGQLAGKLHTERLGWQLAGQIAQLPSRSPFQKLRGPPGRWQVATSSPSSRVSAYYQQWAQTAWGNCSNTAATVQHMHLLLQHASKELQLSRCSRSCLETHFEHFKRVADDGGQHARDHCAPGFVPHFLLQRLAQTDAYGAVGGGPQAGGLNAGEKASCASYTTCQNRKRNYTTEDPKQSKARQRNSGDDGRQRETILLFHLFSAVSC